MDIANLHSQLEEEIQNRLFKNHLASCLIILASALLIACAQSRNVNVENTPNVNITNRVDNPVLVEDVQHPAFQPFEVDKLIQVPENTPVLSAFLPAVGSENQVAVIEHVTVDARVPLGQRIVVRIGQTGELEHSLVLTSQGIWGNSHRYLASQPVRLYYSGGWEGLIFVIIERTSSSAGKLSLPPRW